MIINSLNELTTRAKAEKKEILINGNSDEIIVGTVLGLICNKLLFNMLISYNWGDPWTFPLIELSVIILIVVFSIVLAVYAPIKRIRNMSIINTISAQ